MYTCTSEAQQITEYNGIAIPKQTAVPDNEKTRVMVMLIDKLIYESGLPNINLTIACGIAGNVKVESEFNYTAVNKRSGAFGLCQWYKSRFENLYNYCKQNNLSYESPEGQIKFLVHELKEVSTYRKVYDKISSPEYRNDIDKIAHYFCMHFEIPGEQYCTTRGQKARQVYQEYNSIKQQS